MATYKANRRRYKGDNIFSNEPGGKTYVGTTYYTSANKAVSDTMDNQSKLVKYGKNPLGWHI